MLNLFPIQWLALLAYFILRVFVGLVLLIIAKRQIMNYKNLVTTSTWPFFKGSHIPILLLIVSELVIAFMLILGVYTQAAALGLLALSIKMIIWRNRFSDSSIPSSLLYLLLIGCSLSIFITGAGAIAFDLPI